MCSLFDNVTNFTFEISMNLCNIRVVAKARKSFPVQVFSHSIHDGQ